MEVTLRSSRQPSPVTAGSSPWAAADCLGRNTASSLCTAPTVCLVQGTERRSATFQHLHRTPLHGTSRQHTGREGACRGTLSLQDFDFCSQKHKAVNNWSTYRNSPLPSKRDVTEHFVKELRTAPPRSRLMAKLRLQLLGPKGSGAATCRGSSLNQKRSSHVPGQQDSAYRCRWQAASSNGR